MGYLQRSKWSDNEQRTVEVTWGIFFVRIWLTFLFLRAVVNIPIQTLLISPWLLFRKMIISQLELGPPVERTSLFVVYAIAVNVRSAGQKKDYELSVQVRASDLPNFRSDTLPNEL